MQPGAGSDSTSGYKVETNVPGLDDLQLYACPQVIADHGCMATRNNLLLLTGLAWVEGENVMYTRASDNRPPRR